MNKPIHIEENVEIINKAWFKEILDYCDSAVCEPRDLINAHAFKGVRPRYNN